MRNWVKNIYIGMLDDSDWSSENFKIWFDLKYLDILEIEMVNRSR